MALLDAAQESVDARWLEAGQLIARELKGGESHLYQLSLSVGQYAYVVVDQIGIDVVVSLFASLAMSTRAGANGQRLLHAEQALLLVQSLTGDQRTITRRLYPSFKRQATSEAITLKHISSALRDLGRLDEAKINIEKSIALLEYCANTLVALSYSLLSLEACSILMSMALI